MLCQLEKVKGHLTYIERRLKILFHQALKRLLSGTPTRVKVTGKLTLNKINNEAGLRHSYIYKFDSFVEYANPIIEKFNEEPINDDIIPPSNSDNLTELEKLRQELKHEKKLKNEYRLDKKDLQKRFDLLEEKYQNVVYQLFLLQNSDSN